MLFQPYIMFEGNAKEALDFYGKALGATEDPYIMPFTDGPEDCPPGWEDKVMHAELKFPGGSLYLSDCFPGTEVHYTDAISFNLEPDSEEELLKVFSALSEGGDIVQALEKQFWGGIFGSLIDRYGIHWSFNYTIPRD